MKNSNQQKIIDRVKNKDLRWLRKHFFALMSETVSVKVLIDQSTKGEYLEKCFNTISSDLEKVEQLNRALTESAIHKKIALLIFTTSDNDDGIGGIRNKLEEMNRDIVRTIQCLPLKFAAFSDAMRQAEHGETAIVYLSECIADRADDIKTKLSCVIGHLGKDNVVIFCKNCELSDTIKNFIHDDTGVICERVSILGL